MSEVYAPSYKILATSGDWQNYQAAIDVFHGIELDQKDGFIHLSYLENLDGTLKKHYSGQQVKILLVDLNLTEKLHDDVTIKIEFVGSRQDKFPHLYPPLLYKDTITSVYDAVEGEDGSWTLVPTDDFASNGEAVERV